MRDNLIQIAQDNPIDIEIVMEHGDFKTRGAALEWMRRQESAGNLRCVGLRKDANGRKVVKVFCNGWEPKDDNLRHEIMGTKFRLMYPAFEFKRGYKLSDCYPDLMMTEGEATFEIEIDCGSLKHKQVTWRWKRHKCNNDILIVVAPKMGDPEQRLQSLLEWSDELGDRGFFTTLDRLKAHGPHARVWEYRGRGDAPLKHVPPVEQPCEGHTEATPELAFT